MRLVIPLLLLMACSNADEPTWRSGEIGSSSWFGMAGGRGTGGGTDTSSGTEDPCPDGGVCELTVGTISVSPGGTDTGHRVQATATGGGNISVFDDNVAFGCCPSISVSAVLDSSSGIIEPTVTLGNDQCACFNVLDVEYSLGGVPVGTWTVQSGDASVDVTVN